MIKKASTLQPQKKDDVCGGKGSLFITRLLHPEEIYQAGRGVSKVVIPPGGSCGEHLHTVDCEAYYILKGKALALDNGTPHELYPGDLIFCDVGGTHAIENIGEGDLEYIAVVISAK